MEDNLKTKMEDDLKKKMDDDNKIKNKKWKTTSTKMKMEATSIF